MRQFTLLLVILLVAIALGTDRVRAAQIELMPVADTTVKKSDPGTSFGSAPSLDVLYESGTDPNNSPIDVQESLIKFDLSSIPTGMYITSAKLILTGYGTSTFGYSDIRIRRATNSWSESTTWNSRPSYAEESEANLEVASNKFPSEITLTSIVSDWYTSQVPNYGIVIRPYGDGDYTKGLFTGEDAHASSKEGPTPPRLVITYSTTPLPSPTAGSGSPTPASQSTPTGTATSGEGGSDAISGSSILKPIEPVAYDIQSCVKEIKNQIVSVTDATAELTFQTRDPILAKVYYYSESKVTPPGSKSKNAVGYDSDAKNLSDTIASLSHRFVLSPLEAKKPYFYTLFAGSTQECEHTFTTLNSITAGNGPSVLSGASKGLRTENDSSAKNWLQNLKDLAQKSGLLLTGGRRIPGYGWLGLLLSFLMLLTLGSPTVVRVGRWYKMIVTIPNKLALLLLKKKTRGTWGKIISSQTLRSIPGVILSLYNAHTGALVDRTASDARGLYGFLADPGVYRLVARHGGHSFPALLMPYGYQGTPFKIESFSGVIQLDIAMDPAEVTSVFLQQLEPWLYKAELLRIPLTIAGVIFSIMALTESLTLLNGLLLLGFALAGAWEFRRRAESRYQITLINPDGAPVAFAQLVLKNNRGRVILRRIANKQGKLFLEAHAGEYAAEVITLPGENRPAAQSVRKVTLRSGLIMKQLTLKL